MMYDDIDRYFGLGKSFGGMTNQMLDLLESKYKQGEIDRWVKKFDLFVPKERNRHSDE